RLQVLLTQRAFAAGLEVSDLVDLARVGPALGTALAVDDVDTLVQRRLLWSLRPTRPWERLGPVQTVFELADAGADKDRQVLFVHFADLLLATKGRPMMVCGRGTWFEDDWITQLPRTIQISVRRRQDDPGFDLIVDSLRFRFTDNPEDTADRLERW